ALVKRALSLRRHGPYTLQTAIAAGHAGAPSNSGADWAQVVNLDGLLAKFGRPPVVGLNRAFAVAMRDGPLAGVELVDGIVGRSDLNDCRLAHVLHADLCRRLGKTAEARASYRRALGLAWREPERRFLQSRLSELPE